MKAHKTGHLLAARGHMWHCGYVTAVSGRADRCFGGKGSMHN